MEENALDTKVFKRGCRISEEARAHVEAEIARGCRYYNDMIGALNRDISGAKARGEQPEIEGRAARIERLCKRHISDEKAAKSLAAKAIYKRIARIAKNVRATFTAAKSGCYTGTYHAVQADFDRAVSAKRPGVWPGAPYRYRDTRDSGAIVGVHIQPAKPWRWVLDGRSEICQLIPDSDDGRFFRIRLKVSKEHTIEVSIDRGNKCRGKRLDIPDFALVSHVYVMRTGDYATGGKYEVRIVYKTPKVETDPVTDRIGVDLGWRSLSDGSLLVAVTSDGRQCIIPDYAVRMALRVPELQSERDNLANVEKQTIMGCQAKSPSRLADFIERNGLGGHDDWLEKEHELHCRQAHVARRYQNIRTDVYRKFANSIRGRANILKTTLKRVAEEELKGENLNYDRTIASCFMLAQLLKNAGAIEVTCERQSDSYAPTVENAELIRTAPTREGAARKTVRKFRKTKKS